MVNETFSKFEKRPGTSYQPIKILRKLYSNTAHNFNSEQVSSPD